MSEMFKQKERNKMKIKLGQKYRDKVSGFEGIAVGKSDWMTGCTTVGLQPGMDKDGKLPDLTWLDENRLELVKEKAAKIKTDRKRGGPQDNPPQGTCK